MVEYVHILHYNHTPPPSSLPFFPSQSRPINNETWSFNKSRRDDISPLSRRKEGMKRRKIKKSCIWRVIIIESYLIIFPSDDDTIASTKTRWKQSQCLTSLFIGGWDCQVVCINKILQLWFCVTVFSFYITEIDAAGKKITKLTQVTILSVDAPNGIQTAFSSSSSRMCVCVCLSLSFASPVNKRALARVPRWWRGRTWEEEQVWDVDWKR